MKFLYSADTHFSAYSQDKIDNSTNLPERLSYLYKSITNMVEFGIKNGIKTTIFGGDTYHNKSIIHSVAQSVFLDIIRKYKEMIFILLDGNHDMSSMSGDGISATKSLDNEINVQTIHEMTQIENILLVPWNPKKMIDEIKGNKADYLISHFGLNEGKLNSGISIKSDIGLKDLVQYSKVLLGHYHAPQTVGNVVYVGSPIQLDMGEKNEEKRFLVVDSEKDTIESIPTDGYKKYYKLSLNKENSEEIIKQARELQEQGHIVKIDKFDFMDTDEIGKEFTIIDKTEKDITNRGLSTNMTNSEKLMKYLEIKEVEESERENYFKVAIDLMSCLE